MNEKLFSYGSKFEKNSINENSVSKVFFYLLLLGTKTNLNEIFPPITSSRILVVQFS